MSDEVTRTGPQDPSHDCLSAAWRAGSGGWYCAHCGRFQCTLTGRVAIQRPDLHHPERNLKPLARAFVRKHGTENWTDLGPIEDPVITVNYSEAEQALIESFWNTFGLSDDDEWGSEVS